MFWLILTLVTAGSSVSYLIIGALPGLVPMSDERRRKFHRAGLTLIVLTLACLAKYLTHAT